MHTCSIALRGALALGMLGLAGGCVATKKNAAAADGSGLKLDVHGSWDDPETDYARAIPEVGDPKDAVVNPQAPTILITNATVLTAAGQRIDGGALLLRGGAIEYVGTEPPAAGDDATVIDAGGRFVTPGIIDAHSHIGVYASPHVKAHSDGNEMTAPVTAEVRAEYGYWPQDPAITRARAGGVTTALILPGSANLVGGHGFTVVMRPGNDTGDVRFPGAPATVKMACGENPKRVYGEKGGPATRMGEYAAFRQTFQQAAEYAAKKKAYRRTRALWEKKRTRAAELEAEAAKNGKDAQRVPVEAAPEPPARDPRLETLAGILAGEVLVQIHCYRADEISQMVAIANEFGFPIRSFHHALEAYKVRDLLAEQDIAINTWADWWGFKMEALDGIPENAALMTESGGRATIHSDSSIGIQRLNQEAAKALYAGLRAGVELTEDQALRWITANPAWVLGIDEVTGTLEAGKRADVVLWSHHPFSVYTKADLVIQGGQVSFDRADGMTPTDFELGNAAEVEVSR
jgi:imidazolonepropionase-like amidohydrolase